MAVIYSIKMKNGDDVLGVFMGKDSNGILLENPISLDVNPTSGVFSKSYMLFSRGVLMTFPYDVILFHAEANQMGISYYLKAVKMEQEQYNEDDEDELELQTSSEKKTYLN